MPFGEGRCPHCGWIYGSPHYLVPYPAVNTTPYFINSPLVPAASEDDYSI